MFTVCVRVQGRPRNRDGPGASGAVRRQRAVWKTGPVEYAAISVLLIRKHTGGELGGS